jgi:formylglycine-generating enzyme required for sulfatase activity
MKLSVKLLLACLFVASFAQAAVTTVPEFDALMVKYGNDVRLSAGAIYEAGVSELKLKYTTALERALKTAQDAGKLEEALAYKSEVKLVADGGDVAAEAETAAPDLKKFRAIYHQSLARLEQDKIKATNPVITALLVSIDQLVANLTKAGRLEEALFVKQKKDNLEEETTIAATAVATTNTTTNIKPVSGKGEFTNTLGMKFVPVPSTKLLFCIHETRKQDYAVFAAAVPGMNEAWKNMVRDGIPVSDKDDHPVVGAAWDDVKVFCDWLSKKEGKTYRLPTDHEWSIAVGIGREERLGKDITPEVLSGKIADQYPWGGKFTPKKKDKIGNYADTAFKEVFPKDPFIEGYTDGFGATAPVMSFPPNHLGLYDMGGNVWEWCEDTYNTRSSDRVLRGGCYLTNTADQMTSSFRLNRTVLHRTAVLGFRLVLEVQP